MENRRTEWYGTYRTSHCLGPFISTWIQLPFHKLDLYIHTVKAPTSPFCSLFVFPTLCLIIPSLISKLIFYPPSQIPSPCFFLSPLSLLTDVGIFAIIPYAEDSLSDLFDFICMAAISCDNIICVPSISLKMVIALSHAVPNAFM